MTHTKWVLVVLVALFLVMACSNTPVAQEVTMVTATPMDPAKSSPTPDKESGSLPTVTPRPIHTPQPTPTPRIWPFSDSAGEWVVDTEKSSLTDKDVPVAWIQPAGSTRESKASLLIRCSYGETDRAGVFVTFDNELDDTGFVEVQFRFDEGAIETEIWRIYAPNLVAPNFNSESSIEFVTEFIWTMMNSRKLSIREEGGQTLVFDIVGLANVLYPHRDECNWIQP